MPKWQYLIHDHSDLGKNHLATITRLEERLDRLGSEGWEAFAVERLENSRVVYLRRPDTSGKV